MMSSSTFKVFAEGVKQALEMFAKGRPPRPGEIAKRAKTVMEVAGEVAKGAAKLAGKGR